MSSLIIIPARQHSTRCPDKPLRMIHGRPLLWWTYRRARETNADNVIVTSSDKEVGNACKHFEIPFWPSTEQPTGTHRCAEVLSRVKKSFDVVVNWQCDEPCIPTSSIQILMEIIKSSQREYKIATLAVHEKFVNWRTDTNRVKVRITGNGAFYGINAFDFTRVYLPGSYEHVGIYAFDSKTLSELGDLPLSMLSNLEGLEQMTWLELGLPIYCHLTRDETLLSINTEEDLAKAEEILSL